MPKSKHRKKSVSNRPSVKTPLTSLDGVIHIRAKTFEQLRTNDDFVNLIRVGRALNTIAVSFERITVSGEDQKRWVFGVRATFILGGYVHETLLLAESLRKVYEGRHFFEPFLKLLDNDQPRKLIKNIRNHAAFHLDWQDKTTTVTLSNFEQGSFPFMSFHDTKIKGPYFDLADQVDISFLFEDFRDDRSEEEALVELANTIGDLALELADAAGAFILGIMAKLGLLPPAELMRRTNRGETVIGSNRWLTG